MSSIIRSVGTCLRSKDIDLLPNLKGKSLRTSSDSTPRYHLNNYIKQKYTIDNNSIYKKTGRCGTLKRRDSGYSNVYNSKPPLSITERGLKRCVAESNHCCRFCRPVPDHSANAPNLLADYKYSYIFCISKIFPANISIVFQL